MTTLYRPARLRTTHVIKLSFHSLSYLFVLTNRTCVVRKQYLSPFMVHETSEIKTVSSCQAHIRPTIHSHLKICFRLVVAGYKITSDSGISVLLAEIARNLKDYTANKLAPVTREIR